MPEATTTRIAEVHDDSAYAGGPWSLPERMGLERTIDALRGFLARWVEDADEELREMLGYQLSPRSKYFRPVTLFACNAAAGDGDHEALLPAAAAAELLHNYATVVDDVVDRDRIRRGQLSLHCRYGLMGAQMTCAYLALGATDLVAEDAYAVRLFSRLAKRIAAVECRQWRLRRQPLGVDAWRAIAGEDTGAMFETCARLGTRDDRLARYGYLLGTLYHGCDDIADIRGTLALGAHSERDVTDRILTLPAAIATRDTATARLFAERDTDADAELLERLADALPAAEAVLDELAREAEREARAYARRPDGLVDLVAFTRELACS